MNTDADQLLARKKRTASITCVVAAILVLASLFLPWLKAAKPLDAGMTLLSFERCDKDRDYATDRVTAVCKSRSNFELVDELNAKYQRDQARVAQWTDDEHQRNRTPSKPGTSFAYFGLATMIMAALGVVALGAAGILGLNRRFISAPIAVTSVALVTLCLALVLGCIFVAVKPGDGEFGRFLGVSWPFFIFGIGIVGGIAGAQMLGKAYGPPEYDPYADPNLPT